MKKMKGQMSKKSPARKKVVKSAAKGGAQDIVLRVTNATLGEGKALEIRAERTSYGFRSKDGKHRYIRRDHRLYGMGPSDTRVRFIGYLTEATMKKLGEKQA